jgi:hypothetical protein
MLRKLVWLLSAMLYLFLAGQAEAGVTTTYTVAPNDTLSKIAKKFYGNMADSTISCIEQANKNNANLKDRIQHRDRIYPGQVFTFSCGDVQVAANPSTEAAKPQVSRRTVSPAVEETSSVVGREELPNLVLASSGSVGNIQAPSLSQLLERTVPYDSRKRADELHILEMDIFACGLSRDDCPLFLSITRAENPQRACNARSVVNIHRDGSRSVDVGPGQVNSKNAEEYKYFDLTNCQENIIASYIHFLKYGPGMWTMYTNGTYRSYLGHYRSFAANLEQHKRRYLEMKRQTN